MKVDGAGEYYDEQNKTIREIYHMEKQLYGFTHVRNISNSQRDLGDQRENKWEKSGGVTKHERLLTLGKEQRVVEGEVGKGMG